ncbi:TPA: hypothetical protein ACH3X2_005436 [Trebouxia sp. C0005]
MSALGGTLRQEGLKVAEARVRALTREVGSLKEDLRREIKRRERATLNIREAEEFKQEAEKRVKQLEYSKRKLEQESFAAQEESRANAAKSRAAATCAREELAAYEGNLAEQTADSHHQLQHICTHLQELQMLLFSPAELGDPPLSSGVAPLVESKLKAVMHALSHLSSTLPGEPTCSALTAPASPCCHGRQEHKSHHKELERLRTEVALLRAQNQVQQDTSCRSQAANDMESLIPEYRSTLARMKRQVDELHSKLEDACCERDSLQQQVENTRKAVKLGGNAKKSKRNSSPRVRPDARCSSIRGDEDAKQLIKDIRGLKHRCQALEAQADSLGVTNCELQTALAGKEEQLQRQARVIADLEATITAQSSDIRTALQLVTHKHDRSQPGNDDMVPASYPQRSPCKSALRQRPAAQCYADSPGQQRADVQTMQWHAAIDRCSSLRPQRLHQHSSSMDMLCRDMQQLDAQIADLDLNLVSASRRLHC